MPSILNSYEVSLKELNGCQLMMRLSLDWIGYQTKACKAWKGCSYYMCLGL